MDGVKTEHRSGRAGDFIASHRSRKKIPGTILVPGRNGDFPSNPWCRAGFSRHPPILKIFATLDHNLGIDVNTATIEDSKGRPRYLVEEGTQPIRELI